MQNGKKLRTARPKTVDSLKLLVDFTAQFKEINIELSGVE